MRVAIATFAGLPPGFTDDALLAATLVGMGVQVARLPWDDPEVDWSGFDAVVIRSTWDYTPRREEFLRWTESVGARLHNSPAIVRWNSDKRYLADLARAGLPVVPTSYVGPGDPVPTLAGEVVVKPTVSAGARDTGRFGPARHEEAIRLVEHIRASGRTAMVQPFQGSVDTLGETGVVWLAGEPSHALRKGAVLRPDEVAPVRLDDPVGAAEAMYDPGLVVGSVATSAELDLARAALAEVARRFGGWPVYARVDMVAGDEGAPVLMELELIEPHLYLDQAPGSAQRVARAIVARAGG